MFFCLEPGESTGVSIALANAHNTRDTKTLRLRVQSQSRRVVEIQLPVSGDEMNRFVDSAHPVATVNAHRNRILLSEFQVRPDIENEGHRPDIAGMQAGRVTAVFVHQLSVQIDIGVFVNCAEVQVEKLSMLELGGHIEGPRYQLSRETPGVPTPCPDRCLRQLDQELSVVSFMSADWGTGVASALVV